MPNLKGIVDLHKAKLKNLINSSEVTVKIRLPVDRVSSSVNPLFGDMTRETDDTGDVQGPYKCLWYDAFSGKNLSSTGTGIERSIEAMSGQFRDATAFIELWLNDVLVDPTDITGATWFDRAKHVIVLKDRFDVLGSTRLGLSTASPYLIMVAIKGSLGYDE